MKMFKNTGLFCCLLVFWLSLSSVFAVEHGVSFWGNKNAIQKNIEQLNPSWVYNWGGELPKNIKLKKNVEFVPMIWGKEGANDEALLKKVRKASVLLGFNEPDHKKQANMTPKEALDLWPKLEKTGLRLGSPAPASNPFKGWLAEFMKGVDERGYRVDFIAVHFYSPKYDDPVQATKDFKVMLEKTYKKYKRPIWITEWALANWKKPATIEQQMAFMSHAMKMLSELDYVERQVWFSLPTIKDETDHVVSLSSADLMDENGHLNRLGKHYMKLCK